MVKNDSIREINEQLAQKIRRQGKKSSSKYAKKFVGLAKGEIVIIADSLKAASDYLRKLDVDASECYIVDVAANYDRVYEI